MRTEPAIVVQATELVGPSRLRVQTASSAKLPVVVVEQRADGPVYHVFTVAGLQAGLADRLASDPLVDALELAALEPIPHVPLSDADAADVGTPVVENGRVLGVRAADAIELAEVTEADMDRKRRAPAPAAPVSGDEPGGEPPAERRGLWKRLTRSGE